MRFAHNAEEQFARLLDFYGVAWEYEPRTFELDHDADGQVTRAFTPDFYPVSYTHLTLPTNREV